MKNWLYFKITELITLIDVDKSSFDVRIVDDTEQYLRGCESAARKEYYDKTLTNAQTRCDANQIFHLKGFFSQVEFDIKREKKIEKLRQNTAEELKIYLAGKPVAYNVWKDADYETLVEITVNQYEEQGKFIINLSWI